MASAIAKTGMYTGVTPDEAGGGELFGMDGVINRDTGR
jgi:hypothetical protein